MAKKKGGGGANWMDTYGDMVTLLLCFFVLLYSMSTISEDKWKAIVMSFNPNAKFDPTEIVGGNDGPSADPLPTDPADDPGLDLTDQEAIEQALLSLYEQLKEYVAESSSAAEITVTKGDGYVFISFNESVVFGGNQTALSAKGKKVLTDVAGILDKAADCIDEVRVFGHTSQADMSRPNHIQEDRVISSTRSAMAAAWIESHVTRLKGARIVSEGYGMHRPITSNVTLAGKSQNRRVEILVSGKNILSELGDSLERYDNIVGIGSDGPAEAAG